VKLLRKTASVKQMYNSVLQAGGGHGKNRGGGRVLHCKDNFLKIAKKYSSK
jgi:hypothetical protein